MEEARANPSTGSFEYEPLTNLVPSANLNKLFSPVYVVLLESAVYLTRRGHAGPKSDKYAVLNIMEH